MLGMDKVKPGGLSVAKGGYKPDEQILYINSIKVID